MIIHRTGSRPSVKAPPEYFTGTVRQDPVIETASPARLRAVLVTFEPGARTHWHTHPLGQTLVIVSGSGRIQKDGGPIESVNPGDVVWFAPGERHWHGASANTAMAHYALQEALDGKAVEWLEPVTDAQYTDKSG